MEPTPNNPTTPANNPPTSPLRRHGRNLLIITATLAGALLTATLFVFLLGGNCGENILTQIADQINGHRIGETNATWYFGQPCKTSLWATTANTMFGTYLFLLILASPFILGLMTAIGLGMILRGKTHETNQQST